MDVGFGTPYIFYLKFTVKKDKEKRVIFFSETIPASVQALKIEETTAQYTPISWSVIWRALEGLFRSSPSIACTTRKNM